MPSKKNPKLIKITKDICRDTLFKNENVYLIAREVHVRKSATLYIEKNTLVLFKSGLLEDVAPKALPYASLVIDSGASLYAKDVTFEAERQTSQSTGGLIIAGTLKDAVFEPDQYDTVVSKVRGCPGYSKLINVSFNYLGSQSADLNALTLFQVDGTKELFLSNISIREPGDDGVEIFGGDHKVDQLTVIGSAASDDLVDLSQEATLHVSEALILQRPALINPANGQAIGPGLIEVVGTGTSKLTVAEGARLVLFGRLYDNTPNNAGGSFNAAPLAPLSNQIVAAFAGRALADTFVEDTTL